MQFNITFYLNLGLWGEDSCPNSLAFIVQSLKLVLTER